MSTAVDQDEDTEDYPVLRNQEILPAYPEDDLENGWRKRATWQMSAATSGGCGDDAVGMIFSGAYVNGPIDGLYMHVEENYFVTAGWTDYGDERRKHFDVQGQYTVIICTDPEDPGSSEVWSDVTYDGDLHALFIWSYNEAQALARSLALSDQRFTLLHWAGGIPSR